MVGDVCCFQKILERNQQIFVKLENFSLIADILDASALSEKMHFHQKVHSAMCLAWYRIWNSSSLDAFSLRRKKYWSSAISRCFHKDKLKIVAPYHCYCLPCNINLCFWLLSAPAGLFAFEYYEIRVKKESRRMQILDVVIIPLLLMVLEIMTIFPDNSYEANAYADNFTARMSIKILKHFLDAFCKLGREFG